MSADRNTVNDTTERKRKSEWKVAINSTLDLRLPSSTWPPSDVCMCAVTLKFCPAARLRLLRFHLFISPSFSHSHSSYHTAISSQSSRHISSPKMLEKPAQDIRIQTTLLQDKVNGHLTVSVSDADENPVISSAKFICEVS